MKEFLLDLLSSKLGSSKILLEYLIETAPSRYKVYKIPKRSSGKFRTIAQPTKELKVIQRLLLEELFHDVEVHECATAYVKGKNIKDNALAHVDGKYMLKMDFKNFFPSIVPSDFFGALSKVYNIDFSENDTNHLKNIFFWFNKENKKLELSIGAPSSPFISNMVMTEFDKRIHGFCSKESITYTRYADDLCFSTTQPNKLKSVEQYVIEITSGLERPKLEINKQKTVHTSKKHNRHITGITITNEGKLSLGRNRKKKYSAMIHHFINDRLNHEDIQKLKGYMAFANDIEPEFIIRLKRKYSNEVIRSLVHSSKESNKPKGDYEISFFELEIAQANSDISVKNYVQALSRLNKNLSSISVYPDQRAIDAIFHGYYLKVVCYSELKDVDSAESTLYEMKEYLRREGTIQAMRYLVRSYLRVIKLHDLNGISNDQILEQFKTLTEYFNDDYEINNVWKSYLNYKSKR